MKPIHLIVSSTMVQLKIFRLYYSTKAIMHSVKNYTLDLDLFLGCGYAVMFSCGAVQAQ
jgi:hypothetical protein